MSLWFQDENSQGANVSGTIAANRRNRIFFAKQKKERDEKMGKMLAEIRANSLLLKEKSLGYGKQKKQDKTNHVCVRQWWAILEMQGNYL